MKRLAVWGVYFCIILGLGISQAQSETLKEDTAVNRLNLSSPEAVWDHFKTAMLKGNYDLALECCCPENNNFVQRLTKFGQVKTNRVFSSVTSIEKVFQDNASAQYKVHRNINGTDLTTYVSFANIEGQWKITNY